MVLAGLLIVCCALLAAAHWLRTAMTSCVAYSRVLPPALRVIVRTRDCAGARREGEGSGRRGVQGAESAVGRAETHVVSTPGYFESSECREYPIAPYTLSPPGYSESSECREYPMDPYTVSTSRVL